MPGSPTRLSFPTQIVLGLGLGVCAGLFFGEMVSGLQVVADIYIRLMQMMVLPYLVTALILAFGSLSAREAGFLARHGALLLLVVWGMTALVVTLSPLTFPRIESASFFSTALLESKTTFSLAETYFTSNPFESLARPVVPAVVLFASLVGIGLIGLEGKEKLLGPLSVWNAVAVRVTRMVLRLTPIGVFAIGAVAAGTLTLEVLARLEVYVVAFAGLSVLLAFWILPLLVSAVTPFSRKEVAGLSNGALLTAFVTGNAFIVLPILVEQSQQLIEKHGLSSEAADGAVEVLVPVLFNFPNAGKLLVLLFVPFAAWLHGAPLPAAEYPMLFAAGIPSLFASAQVALPWLLDLFDLPHDLFHLYVGAEVLTIRFKALAAAMNLQAFALLGAAAMGGFLQFEARRLLRTALGMLVGTAALFVAVGLFLAASVDTTYTMDEAVRRMQGQTGNLNETVHREAIPISEELRSLGALERVHRSGTLRVGYDPDNLPMSFFNGEDELVGFDVQLSRRLAAAMKVRLEFVPIRWPDLARMLADGEIDVMPGIWYRPFWFPSIRLSQPYLTGTMGLAVRDERRHDFTSVEALRTSRGLRIAVPLERTQVALSMERYFGDADVEFVTQEFWKDYFEGKVPGVDGFLMPAENASAWTLLHPEYTVVVPQPDPVRIPYAFGMALDSAELANAVNEWILYASEGGEVRIAYRYWMLGEGARDDGPRWSVIRDVLGWVE